MTDKKPKPFHFGTKVRRKNPSPDYLKSYEVRACTHSWLWCIVIGEARHVTLARTMFVHADDGSPLGEWVPIRNDSHDDGFEGSIDYRAGYSDATSRANAILRGEVEQ